MNAVSQILALLSDTILGLLVVALLLRFYLQLVRAPFSNPIGQSIIKVTNFMVRPARRILPSISKFDFPTIVCAYIVEFVMLSILLILRAGLESFNISAVILIAITSLMKLFTTTIYMLMFALVVDALMSWFSPFHPLRGTVGAFVNPILVPIQRVMPRLGGLDLSSFVAFLGLQVLLILFEAPVKQFLLGG